jgi:hypothetical protein
MSTLGGSPRARIIYLAAIIKPPAAAPLINLVCIVKYYQRAEQRKPQCSQIKSLFWHVLANLGNISVERGESARKNDTAKLGTFCPRFCLARIVQILRGSQQKQ